MLADYIISVFLHKQVFVTVFLLTASSVNSIWNEAARLPFFWSTEWGILLLLIMCEQTRISSLT